MSVISEKNKKMARFGPILFYYSLNICAQFEICKNLIGRFQKPNYIKILTKKWLICARRPRNMAWATVDRLRIQFSQQEMGKLQII
jgi:hypothetical protein